MSLAALQDLFLRHRERRSGVWKVGQEPSRTLYLDAGDIVFAQSTAPEDRLTAILVEKGKLTQAQLDYAMGNLKPGLSIGKNLIEMGFITQRDLLDTARSQVERIVWGGMATEGVVPTFDPKELEPTVVRLPLDTPAMLLAGLLNLRNREGVLDLLGPLNQVVVLEGRRVNDLQLPQDLAKILPMLDGSRTLLELSREGSVEPFRLGAFSLYLRFMGWARLHELPPLDRGALDRALLPEAEPLSADLPPAAPEPAPALFAAIEASQRPTTNLEHLSHALDELPEAPEFPEPAPTPALPLPPLPEVEPEEPRLEIHEGSTFAIEPPSMLQAPAEPASPSRLRPILLALVAAGLAFGAWRWKQTRASAPPPAPVAPPTTLPPRPHMEARPAPVEPKAAAPQETPQPPVVEITDKASENKKIQPESKPQKETDASPKERLSALQAGDMDRALAQGRRHLKALKTTHWTLRLEVACQTPTVQRAAEMLGGSPDLWILSMRMRDGKDCYQVMLGDFATEAAANQAATRLPAAFRAPGNRPRAFRLDQIPDKQ